VNASSVAAEQASTYGATVGHVYEHALSGYSARMSPAAAARLANDPRVASVQADGVASIAAQTLPTGINRADADLSPTAAINGVDTRVNVDVAVIDTGIDLTHPDLNVYTAGAKNCSTGNSANDGNGHGTHVAGTIGALDNAVGVVGMAPGARLWPVRVLNNAGSGSWADVICGVDYVTAHASEIEVANMSLGGSGTDGSCSSDALHQAICNSVAAGVTYAVAAGNSAADASTFVPAAYDEVITVSALADFNGLPGGGAPATCRTDVDDTFADFSNFGSDVDLIAPGVCILSTWKGGGYNTISGTSMASPHVAGGAALYKATHPTASPSAVKSALQAAGNPNWFTNTDPDSTHESLLNVATF
jgi:subtilisin family serine protease